MRNFRAANPTSVGLLRQRCTLPSPVPAIRAAVRHAAKTGANPALTEFSQNSERTTGTASADTTIRVALILASKLERLGWGIVVGGQEDMQVVGQFATAAPALAFLRGESVDVALVDETVLTPKVCDWICELLPRNGLRFLLLARHPVDPARYPFVSGCLLHGATASEFLTAIRGHGQDR
jgi:hypothetical protein